MKQPRVGAAHCTHASSVAWIAPHHPPPHKRNLRRGRRRGCRGRCGQRCGLSGNACHRRGQRRRISSAQATRGLQRGNLGIQRGKPCHRSLDGSSQRSNVSSKRGDFARYGGTHFDQPLLVCKNDSLIRQYPVQFLVVSVWRIAAVVMGHGRWIRLPARFRKLRLCDA